MYPTFQATNVKYIYGQLEKEQEEAVAMATRINIKMFLTQDCEQTVASIVLIQLEGTKG